MTDMFVLYDEDFNEILSRKMVEHIHLAVVEKGLLEGENADRHYTIVSEVTGHRLEVDMETKQEDWRYYSYLCAMALD